MVGITVRQDFFETFRLHRLASAGNPEGLLGAGNQQVLGNRPGLGATASAVQDLIAVGAR
jgi:hypothetical protein